MDHNDYEVLSKWKAVSSIAKNDEERMRFAGRFVLSLLDNRAVTLKTIDALEALNFPLSLTQVARRLFSLRDFGEEDTFTFELQQFQLQFGLSKSSNQLLSPSSNSPLQSRRRLSGSSPDLDGSSVLIEGSFVAPVSRTSFGSASILLERSSGGGSVSTRTGMEVHAHSRPESSLPSFPGLVVERRVVDSGQATVYQGIYTARNLKVAIKVMHEMDANSERAYRGELDALMQLKHPHVLQVITTYENCIVTKWMDGGPLNEWLAKKKSMLGVAIPWAPVGRKLVREIATGLAFLHSEGFVHRDLKSLNVFMDADDTPVLADFGFAKSVDTGSLAVATNQMGTPHWMAPEMIASNIFSFSSDVYALGIIIWEICSCTIPYANMASKRALEDAVLKGVRPPVERSWPSEATGLMGACWAHDPKKRCSAADVCKALGGLSKAPASKPKLMFAQQPLDAGNAHTGTALPQADYIYQQFLELRQDGAYTSASRVLKEAAVAGHAIAQWMVGMYHLTGGLSIEQNVPEAVNWFKQAAERGSQRGMFFLAKTLLNLGQDQEKAKEWLAKAILSGKETSFEDPLVLAECHYFGMGLSKDLKKAFQFYKKAGEDKKDVFALTFLGYCYKGAKGCQGDFKKAFEMFQTAANLGHCEAQYLLGVMYINGMGTKKDRVAGRDWVNKAAIQGLEQAKKELKNLS